MNKYQPGHVLMRDGRFKWVVTFFNKKSKRTCDTCGEFIDDVKFVKLAGPGNAEYGRICFKCYKKYEAEL